MQQIALNAYVCLTSRWSEIRHADRERGLTTTEIAILTFVLVATAAAIGAVLYSYAQDSVQDLPTQTELRAEIESGGGGE